MEDGLLFTLLKLRTGIIHLKRSTPTYHKRVLIYVSGITLFAISFLWFCFPGEYVLIANRDLSLFRTSPDYFLSFMDRPGGLLEYLGSFLGQFFRFRLTGALLLAVMVTSAFYLGNRLITGSPNNKGLIIPGAITPILFMGMHNYYPHQLSHSLGFILVMAVAGAFPHKEIRKRIFRYLYTSLAAMSYENLLEDHAAMAFDPSD